MSTFRSILDMTAEEAKEFCASHNLTPFAVYEEPARLIVPDSMKSTQNRAELEFYLDATDTYRVGKAIVFQEGAQVAVVEPDECDECGGPCDGVHARVSPATPPTEKENRVKELTDTILKIQQMDNRIERLVDLLSLQEPDVIVDVVSRLKESKQKL